MATLHTKHEKTTALLILVSSTVIAREFFPLTFPFSPNFIQKKEGEGD